MIFAVAGGDERMVRLVRLLREDGHRVLPYAMENALECAGPEALQSAEAVILPLPCVRGGRLFAPYSDEKYVPGQILSALPRSTPVLAGQAGSLRYVCSELNLRLFDYFEREELQIKNAVLTAEGAIELMLRSCPRSLSGSRVLICGFGRIGRLLALRLTALGAAVTAAARSPADRAWAESMGCRAVCLSDAALSGGCDFIVSTIPETVLGEDFLKAAGGALLIELASPPYGFDIGASERLGKSVVIASGLPGKTAPESAARAIRDTIYAILEELS